MTVGSIHYMGPVPSMDQITKRAARKALEQDVQNLAGPIKGIADLSDIELYGIRDGIKNRNLPRRHIPREGTY